MEQVINIAAAHVGRADRDKITEELHKGKIFTIKPRTDIEKCIYTLYLTYNNSQDIDLPSAKEAYLNVMNHRHDLWVDLLANSSLLKGFKAGDINVSDYASRINKAFQKNILISLENSTLTPDILYYDSTGDYHIVGDVAVTRTYAYVNSEKYRKYHGIIKDLERSGEKVKWMPFIVKEDLQDINSLLTSLDNEGMIKVSTNDYTRIKSYHQLCNTLMVHIANNVDDKTQFQVDISKMRKKGDMHEDLDMTNLRGLSQSMLEQSEPMVEEDTIIAMVKDEADKVLADGYFDNSVDDTMNAFDVLINSYKAKKHAQAKSTLKVVSNDNEHSHLNSHDLITDYLEDLVNGPHNDESTIRDYVLSLLPNRTQLKLMKSKPDSPLTYKASGVYGQFSYDRSKKCDNQILNSLNYQLSKGKKRPNEKSEPTSIDPEDYETCINFINNTIHHYGSPSNKEPFLTTEWDASNNFETENSKIMKENYDIVKHTNGAQLAHSLSNLYQRIMHIKTSLGCHDNIYTPPNASFVCIIPKEHAPVNSRTCDLPFIFITRYSPGSKPTHLEYEYSISGENYTYYISKLCRLNVDKIECWDQAGYKLVATGSYLLTRCPSLNNNKVEVIGLLTLLMLDSHQKTSEYLDLFKYIAYMPFADISRLSYLIQDKMNIMTKTCFDIWLLIKIRDFIKELSDTTKLDAKKPKILLFNSKITRESLGLSLKLPSFVNNKIRHNTVEEFIEEICMWNIIRPKQLYGSQFLDVSTTKTAEWNNDFVKEVEENGTWPLFGYDHKKPYNFTSKFSYHKDAIIYATRHFNKVSGIVKSQVESKLAKTKYNTFMHNNCSLRGCTKEPENRKNKIDLHTTSMEACLDYYEGKSYIDKKCTSISMAKDFINSGKPMEFSMSEKKQRGSGRPIATPTLLTKAALMAIEKPEQAIGSFADNNIIVEGKNKLKEMSETYKDFVSTSSIQGFKFVAQVAEDQMKYSEMDNIRKYLTYIRENVLLDDKVRKLQILALKKLIYRRHLVKRIPLGILENDELLKWLDTDRTGVSAIIGWPQGMLNFISTSVHCIADKWITYAYQKAYGSRVSVKGLVHSDDSWFVIAYDNEIDFKRFTVFRMLAKRLFCLKLNEKKLWGSRFLGELVSNYNINGNVHLPISKTIANSFCNLMFQNWVVDVHNQISSLQQAYRNGANVPTLIMLKTVLRQQLMETYHIKGRQKELINVLPVELGGFPGLSAFELGVNGLNAHYHQLYNNYTSGESTPERTIVARAIRLSEMKNNGLYVSNGDITNNQGRIKKYNDFTNAPKGDDYDSLSIAHRGDIFTCVKYLMPKSKKVAKTLTRINNIPFESNGLEMLITRPKDLPTALGNLKGQTRTIMYELAAEHYTQSNRRLAVSQSIQSSGKVVRVLDYAPMTFNEMIDLLETAENIFPADLTKLQVAFTDDSSIPELTSLIVNNSTAVPYPKEDRKIINRMPHIEDKYTTIARFRNVLLYIVDRQLKTNYLEDYGVFVEPEELLLKEALLIQKRFGAYFRSYDVRYACNLIMQQYLFSTKSRLWMQPHLRNDTLESFLCDLYGKTCSLDSTYRIEIDYTMVKNLNIESKLVNTIYTMLVLNKLYSGKFIVESISSVEPIDILTSLDYGKLTNDDFLKFAICYNKYLNDDRFLKEYDQRKVYDQYYVTPQKKNARGQYIGYFQCLVSYGKTVLLIEGEPENVKLSVNKPDIPSILFAMQLFVQKNFPFYKYHSPGSWINSQFWSSNKTVSNLFLTSYSNCVTYITKSSLASSIPIYIDDKLQMVQTFHDVLGDEYIVDDHFRVVSKMVNKQSVKVGTVKQTMQCPLSDLIKLDSQIINGLYNDDLIKNNLIVNITLKKYYSNTKSEYREVLSKSPIKPSNQPIIDAFAAIIDYFKDIDYDFEEKVTDHVTEVINVGEVTPSSFIDRHETTAPEDLTGIETEYYLPTEDTIGKMCIHTNIKHLLHQILGGMSTHRDLEEFYYLVLHDNTFFNKVADLVMPSDIFSAESVIEDIKILRYDIEEVEDETLHMFIVGNNLFNANVVKTLDFKSLMTTNIMIYNNLSYIRARSFVNTVLKLIYEETDENKRKKMIELLTNR